MMLAASEGLEFVGWWNNWDLDAPIGPDTRPFFRLSCLPVGADSSAPASIESA